MFPVVDDDGTEEYDSADEDEDEVFVFTLARQRSVRASGAGGGGGGGEEVEESGEWEVPDPSWLQSGEGGEGDEASGGGGGVASGGGAGWKLARLAPAPVAAFPGFIGTGAPLPPAPGPDAAAPSGAKPPPLKRSRSERLADESGLRLGDARVLLAENDRAEAEMQSGDEEED